MMFNEQFEKQSANQEHVDERQLRMGIQLLTAPMTNSQRKTANEVFQKGNSAVNNTTSGTASADASKPAKNMKLSANMYTISYCAFMKDNKEKYRLKNND